MSQHRTFKKKCPFTKIIFQHSESFLKFKKNKSFSEKHLWEWPFLKLETKITWTPFPGWQWEVKGSPRNGIIVLVTSGHCWGHTQKITGLSKLITPKNAIKNFCSYCTSSKSRPKHVQNHFDKWLCNRSVRFVLGVQGILWRKKSDGIGHLTLNLRCGSKVHKQPPTKDLGSSRFFPIRKAVWAGESNNGDLYGGWGLQDPTQEANLKVSFKMAENLGCDYPLWD